MIAAATLALIALAPVTASTTGASQNGGAIVVRQYEPAADLIGTELVLQAGLDRQTPRENGLAAFVAESILQTPANGRPLRDAIFAGGGSLSYTVEPRDVRFYLEGVAGSYPALLALFRTALARPDFSPAVLARVRPSLDAKIAQSQRLALNVGINMLNRVFYENSDAGLPPYGMPETVAGFGGADARAFYAGHYRRGDAIVSVAGNLGPISTGDLGALAAALPAGTSQATNVIQPRLSSNSRQLIARRDVPVPWLVAQYPAPALGSRDFGAMLVLTAFIARTLADVAEVPAIATRSFSQHAVGALYNFDTHPANVIVYVDGGLGDPTRTFATALTVVNVLGHAKLGGDLGDMKSFAAGRFIEETTTLQDRAWLASVFAGQHLRSDYLAAAIAAIDKTSSADLARVASRYLGAPTIALVLPRST